MQPPPTFDSPSDSELDRYLAGELDPRAAECLRTFLDATAGRRGVMAGTRAWWRGEDIGVVPYPVEPGLHELLTRIDAAGEPRHTVRTGRLTKATGRGRPRWFGRSAASAATARQGWRAVAGGVVIAAAVAWTAVSGVRSRRGHAALPNTIYATARGQRANITLPDGSTVALNVASRLEVPADYGTGNHTLHLSGEALFSVVHHDGAPFTVIAGPAVARVLGTSFVVRHYSTDSVTTVAVRDGKVAVRSAVVTAAQQVEVNGNGITRVRPVSPSQFAFAAGVLSLDGVPLSQALVELGRWYDGEIRIGTPALAARRVKGEFSAGSLAELAAILEWTYDVRVVRNGRILTLYSR